jgi:hypothetical protein
MGEGDAKARETNENTETLADGTTVTRTVTRTVKTIQTVDEIPVRTVTKRVVDGAANRPRAIGSRPVPAPEATNGRLTTLGERGNGETATRTPATSASARSRTPLKRYEEMNLEEKVETNEKRLFETQATLVRETMKREVTENILRETAKSLSAVRKAALQGQTVEQTGGALPGSVEHQNGVLITRVKELTQKMQDLHAQHQEKERELQAVRRLLQQRENEFDLIGERPVSINVEIKELNDEGQFELIEQTRAVLQQAQQQAEAVARLRQIDRQRTRALGDLVLTMEARRSELQDKLKEAGLLEEYDDDRVMAGAGKGYGEMTDSVDYEGPLTSPSGRSFYVTRTATFWDRFFGIQI